jgi:prepilin-type N-terminal cleavage/methylation domain-containing protein
MGGFTLIEMMTVIAILGILLAMAVPSFNTYFEKYRTRRAAETVAAFLVNAKSEAIKRNANVRAIFKITAGGTPWCVGLTTASTCDCTTAGSCQIDSADRVVSSADFSKTVMASPDNDDMFSFSHQRGTVNADTVQIESDNNGYTMRVVVSAVGRIRLCSPSDHYIGGYAEC